MSSSNSPCAACKFRRQKCTRECVFAPYFPPDQLQKFATVHTVFGASNVAKVLNELDASKREDAVNSLAYEAEGRLRDPVYGCVGLISVLRYMIKQVQSDLEHAREELETLIGPRAMLPMLQPADFVLQQHMGNASFSEVMQHDMMPTMGIPTGPAPHGGQLVNQMPQAQQHTQQILEAQQLAADVAAWEQQDQHQQPEALRFNSGGFTGASSVTATGFDQISNSVGGMSSSLGLGTFSSPYGQIQPQQHHDAHGYQLQELFLQSEQTESGKQNPQQRSRSGSEKGKSVGLDPFC